MPGTRRIEIRTMPADLLARIDRAASADRRSRSQWIVCACENALKGTMITRAQITQLSTEAAQAGDLDQVAICDRALADAAAQS